MAYTPPRIRSGINEGDAQILPSRDNSDDFRKLGYADGFKSPVAKKRRASDRLEKRISKNDFEKKEGWTVPMIKSFENEKNNVIQTIKSPEFQKEENWEEKGNQMLEELRGKYEVGNNVANVASSTYSDYRTKDESNLYGWEEFNRVYDDDFGTSPETTGGAKPFDFMEVVAQTEARAKGVKEEFENEYEIKDYAFKKTQYPIGDERTGTKFEMTPEAEKLLTSDAISMARSGIKQVKGDALIKRPEDVTFLRDVQDYMEIQYGPQLNSLETEEEIQAFTEEKAVEYLKFRAQQGNKEGVSFKRNKSEKGGFDEKDLSTAKKVKSLVNQFQDNNEVEPINQYLAPYGLSVEVTGDKVQFTKTKTYKDGPVSEPVTGMIDLSDAEAIYNVISKHDPNVKRKAIDQVSFDDPTPNFEKPAPSEALKSDITKIMEGNEDDVLSKFKGVTVERNLVGSDKLKVDEETFNITDENSAKEAFEYLQNRGYGKEQKEEKKDESTTTEDLKGIEGLNKKDRELYLKGDTKNMSQEGWNKAWESLEVGEEMVGPDGSVYVKE